MSILKVLAKGAGKLLGIASKVITPSDIKDAIIPKKEAIPETEFYETHKTKVGDIVRPIIRPLIVLALVVTCVKFAWADETIPYTIKWLALICVPGYLGLKSIEKKQGTSSKI